MVVKANKCGFSCNESVKDYSNTLHFIGERNEEIYQAKQKEPLRLSSYDTGLNLLRHIRDESHRFALTFQRSKRTQSIESIEPNPRLGPKSVRSINILNPLIKLKSQC